MEIKLPEGEIIGCNMHYYCFQMSKLFMRYFVKCVIISTPSCLHGKRNENSHYSGMETTSWLIFSSGSVATLAVIFTIQMKLEVN